MSKTDIKKKHRSTCRECLRNKMEKKQKCSLAENIKNNIKK